MFTERKQQVIKKIENLMEYAKSIYGVSSVPDKVEIRFDLRGRSAGQAVTQFGRYWMRFNVDMMTNDAWDHLYNNTIPHELAHIICMWRRRDTGHGAVWKSVCKTLGGDGNRCHSEEITYARGRTFYYTTSSGKTVPMSQVRHCRIQRGTVYRTIDGGKIDRTCAFKVA